MLGLRASFRDREPGPEDRVEIGIIDTAEGNAWRTLAGSRAWNWQQGCMLQWLKGGEAGEIVFNDRDEGRFIARVLNVWTGAERRLERPVYGVSADGLRAVSLNFARLHHQRPGYGYAGVEDPWRGEAAPAEDGIHTLDLLTGESRLILSLAEAAAFQPLERFKGRIHRFNHLQFSRDGFRFAALHRTKFPEERAGDTRLLTLDFAGGGLANLSDFMVSHYDWADHETLLAWAERPALGRHYFLFRDRSAGVSTMGERWFSGDGHCSFSPDGRWVLTDTYPDKEYHRSLMLYDRRRDVRIDIGRFYSIPTESPIRCDLHPRWSRDGRKVCIDSTHEGSRQMYVIDVGHIVQAAGL